MLLGTQPTIKNIIAVQIVKICYPVVYVQTEDQHYVKAQLATTEIQDPVFWETMRDLIKAKLWVPMGRHYHQLLAYDWVSPKSVLA